MNPAKVAGERVAAVDAKAELAARVPAAQAVRVALVATRLGLFGLVEVSLS